MSLKSFFLELFAPEGWPTTVAPEYGRYQFFDTIQQVTYFVNTVISKQAVMKFHGVGDPTKTPAEATALGLSRGLLASTIALLIATPGMIGIYKRLPRPFRMLSEILNSAGHFCEIVAAIFTQTPLLYLGPILCDLSGTMSGSVRSVILQHFACGGELPPGRKPDFGDISLKESNQDKGGKIFGLIIGIALLAYIGMWNMSEGEEASSILKSIKIFAVLSAFHILVNLKAVLQLDIKAADTVPKSVSKGVSHDVQQEAEVSFWRMMFLPKGYPHTVVASYTKYQLWSCLGIMTSYPKEVITSSIFLGPSLRSWQSRHDPNGCGPDRYLYDVCRLCSWTQRWTPYRF